MLFLMLAFNANGSNQEQTIYLMGQEFTELLLIFLLAVNVLHCSIYAFNVNEFQNAVLVLLFRYNTLFCYS